MKNVIFIALVFLMLTKSDAQIVVYKRNTNGSYVRIVHNDETNTQDTFVINLHKNGTFLFYAKGTESKWQMIGDWSIEDNCVIMVNKYPYKMILPVRVLPHIDSCTGYFPDLIDGRGKVTHDFFMNAHYYTYSSGMIIPYAELDSIRDSVRICSNDGNYCSDFFSIPYKDCYRIIIDIDIDPPKYNGAITKMYFRKRKGKLELIKSE